MPRNMSFKMTTNQMRKRTKSVTRRIGWWDLTTGEIVNACVQCQGLPKGAKVERIDQIEILDARAEPLDRMINDREYGLLEVKREGFAHLTPEKFVAMFAKQARCGPGDDVNRILFRFYGDKESDLTITADQITDVQIQTAWSIGFRIRNNDKKPKHWDVYVTLASGRRYKACFAGGKPNESHVKNAFLEDLVDGGRRVNKNWDLV